MQAEPPIHKRTRLERWVRVSVIVVVLAVTADLLLPYVVDADRYSTVIATAIERETRRKVTIGKISARLLPRVGFVVHDFRLGNPQGFAEGDVLTVQSIRGNLAWGPLLHRELSLSSIELVKPRLTLVEDEYGRTNYGASVAKTREWPHVPAGGKSPGGADAGSSASSFRLDALDSIALSNAEVVLGRVGGHGARVAPSVEMKNINLELKNVTLEPIQPKLWQGAANLSGVELALPGWKRPVEIHSGKMNLHDGRLDAEFRAAMGSAAEWKGTLRLADIEHGVPAFELTTTKLDVDQLLALESAEAPPAAPSRAAHAARSELVAQGKIAAEHLRWAALTGNNLHADVRVFSDRLELTPAKLDLYGGTLQISARADRGASPGRFSSSVQVRSLDLGKLLAALDAHGKMSGTGELELQFSGALSPDWQRSLSGSGHFTVRDGRLPGVNLSGALGSVAQMTGAGEETPFKLIEGDLTIAQGRVASKLIHLDSPRGKADLRGSASLDGALDYEGQAVVVPGSAGSNAAASPRDAVAGLLGEVLQRNVASMTVPFAIRGTIHNPRFEPGRGLPSYTAPTKTSPTQPGQPPPQKKSILDLFKRP